MVCIKEIHAFINSLDMRLLKLISDISSIQKVIKGKDGI